MELEDLFTTMLWAANHLPLSHVDDEIQCLPRELTDQDRTIIGEFCHIHGALSSLGCAPISVGPHAAPLAAATTFWAASVRPEAVIIFRPLSWRSFLPAATFVPSSRTTRGT